MILYIQYKNITIRNLLKAATNLEEVQPRTLSIAWRPGTSAGGESWVTWVYGDGGGDSLVPLVMSNFLQPCGLQPLSPLWPWDSAGKNTEVSCNALLQRIFPTQGSNCVSYISCTGGWFLATSTAWEPREVYIPEYIKKSKKTLIIVASRVSFREIWCYVRGINNMQPQIRLLLEVLWPSYRRHIYGSPRIQNCHLTIASFSFPEW